MPFVNRSAWRHGSRVHPCASVTSLPSANSIGSAHWLGACEEFERTTALHCGPYPTDIIAVLVSAQGLPGDLRGGIGVVNGRRRPSEFCKQFHILSCEHEGEAALEIARWKSIGWGPVSGQNTSFLGGRARHHGGAESGLQQFDGADAGHSSRASASGRLEHHALCHQFRRRCGTAPSDVPPAPDSGASDQFTNQSLSPVSWRYAARRPPPLNYG